MNLIIFGNVNYTEQEVKLRTRCLPVSRVLEDLPFFYSLIFRLFVLSADGPTFLSFLLKPLPLTQASTFSEIVLSERVSVPFEPRGQPGVEGILPDPRVSSSLSQTRGFLLVPSGTEVV